MIDSVFFFDRILLIALALGLAAILMLLGLLWHGLAQVRAYAKMQPRRMRLAPVEAYSPDYSYALGATVPLHIHTTASATMTLVRFGAERERIRDAGTVGPIAQDPTYQQTKGYAWPRTVSVATEGLKPGFYGIEIQQTAAPFASFIVPIVLKPAAVPPVAIVLSTNSWDAYNAAGGVSNYENNLLGPLAHRFAWWMDYIAGPGALGSPTLARARPTTNISEELKTKDPYADFNSKVARLEWLGLAFFDREGIDHGIYTDEDLAYDPALLTARVLFFPGHSEYWTREMYYNYDRFVAAGGSVVMCSGNHMWSECEITDSAKRFNATSVGAGEAAFPRTGNAFYRPGAFTAAPFRVSDPACWVFEGTGVGLGDLFGQDSAQRAVPDFASRKDLPRGASAFHIATFGPGGQAFEMIAKGCNPDRAGACMMFRETQEGGFIFSAGSEAFLSAWARDPVVAQMLRNLLARRTSRRDAKS